MDGGLLWVGGVAPFVFERPSAEKWGALASPAGRARLSAWLEAPIERGRSRSLSRSRSRSRSRSLSPPHARLSEHNADHSDAVAVESLIKMASPPRASRAARARATWVAAPDRYPGGVRPNGLRPSIPVRSGGMALQDLVDVHLPTSLCEWDVEVTTLADVLSLAPALKYTPKPGTSLHSVLKTARNRFITDVLPLLD